MSLTTENYVFTLDDETKKYASNILNETEESRRAAFEEINEWVKENPSLHVKLDEKSILAFLRCCKFNLDRTKQKLKNYYLMKRDRSEWYTNRHPSLTEIQELVKLGVFLPLLRMNSDNQLAVIVRVAAHDPKRHNINDVLKVGNMILDVACEENEKAQIYGVTAIFDLKGVSYGHARQLCPAIIKNVVHAWQNNHCRPKRLEFINAPIYINVILNIFKRYMSAKLKGRVRVHFSGVDGVYECVPKYILPKEYGGDDIELKDLADYWCDKLNDYADWFIEDEKYKAEA